MSFVFAFVKTYTRTCSSCIFRIFTTKDKRQQLEVEWLSFFVTEDVIKVVYLYFRRVVTMSRKFIMSRVRLEKKFEEIKSRGFKLRQDLVLCNTHRPLSNQCKSILKGFGVKEELLQYPISLITLVFVNEKRTVCRVYLESSADNVGRIYSETEYNVSSLHLEESDLEYSLYVGDEVPSVGLRGEELVEFEMVSTYPVFESYFKKNDMLLDNMELWSVFNNIELIDKCSDYSKGKMYGIHMNGNNIKNEDWGISYVDEYLDSSFRNQDFRTEISASLDVDVPSKLMTWKYKSMMLNNNVYQALFRFSELEFDVLLSDLRADGYTLHSMGLVNVRSMENSVTVCGFFNGRTYMYTVFYFSKEYECFVVELLYSKSEVKEIRVNNYKVNVVGINVNDGMETTLIRGFDFENFDEYHLI